MNGNEPPKGNGAARKAGLAAAAVAACAAFGYWLYARNFESTDDAFIESHVVAVSPNVSGTVTEVDVADNQSVELGAPLLQIDPRPFQARLDQAKAEVQAAQADADNAEADFARDRQLFKRDAVSKQTLDHASASAQGAQARLELARKRVDADALDLSYARLTAPVAGLVARKSVEVGGYVQAGQQLLALVPRESWVIANFKETQLTRMRAGQPATIRVDAYPGRRFTGRVDSIQSGTGSRFSLLPPENATGNFVKVVQRVPVKIVFDPPPDPSVLLAPGMSVVPEVRVR